MMSMFSKKLQRYVEEKNVKIYTLAKNSGVNRTFIHKMLSDSRVPSDESVVLLLARALLLSSSETQDLVNAYRISKMGEDVWRRRNHVKELLLRFDAPPSQSFKLWSAHSHSLFLGSETEVIEGEIAVHQILRTLLEMEAAKKAGRVSILAQPDFTYLYECLSTIDFSTNQTVIQNILCFDQSSLEDDCRYNLDSLQRLIPTLLACPTFEAYCYHDHVASLFNEWVFLPYMILTSDYVLHISSDRDRAVLASAVNLRELCQRFFQKKLYSAHPVCRSIQLSFQTYLDSLIVTGQIDTSAIHTLLYQPCLFPFIKPETIARHINKALCDASTLERLTAHFATMRSKQPRIYSSFTREGLELFMQTGKITEVPDAYYTYFDPDERRQVLETLCNAAQTELFSPRIIDVAAFDMPLSLSVDALSPQQIILYFNHPDHNAFSLNLTETSLLNAFYDFLVYIQDSALVHSREKSLAVLQEIREKYS